MICNRTGEKIVYLECLECEHKSECKSEKYNSVKPITNPDKEKEKNI